MDMIGEDGALRGEAALILSEQENVDPGAIANYVQDCIRKIQAHEVEERIKQISDSIATLQPEERARALEQLSQYTKRLRLLKDRRD